MRIGILTTADSKDEDKRLIEAAKQRGHKAMLLHVLKCSISVCQKSPEVYYEGEAISQDFDIIIPRIDDPHAEYGLTILRQFQSMHIYTSERARALELGRDKLRCTQRLLRENVPFPATGFAYSKADFDNIIDTVGGVPLIIKLVKGTEGVGVFLADDMKNAINLLKTFKQLSSPLIVQKFIEESAGTDVRVFVIGGKIISSMERQSQDGDFRANLAVGGHSQVAKLTNLEEEIAIKAAHAIGINVSGVDIIRSNNGPLVIEINTSPDFTGKWNLETIANADIAGAIIEYAVHKKIKSTNDQTRLLKEAI